MTNYKSKDIQCLAAPGDDNSRVLSLLFVLSDQDCFKRYSLKSG